MLQPFTRRFGRFLIALAIVLSPLRPAAEACDCDIPTPEAAFAAADAVFSGRVVAILPDGAQHRVFVDLLEIWKGEFPVGHLARVDTPNNTAACGVPFQLGQEYVIFAELGDENLQTNVCTPTETLTREEATAIFGPAPELNPLNVEFRRGDVNADGDVDIADPIASLIFQFGGGPAPSCEETLDFDNDERVNLADAVASLQFQFGGGPPAAAPFGECGKDPDMTPYDCARYDLCPLRPVVNRIVRIEDVGDDVEVEVFSERPFWPRALFPILCVGSESFVQSRYPDSGAFHTLIFTLPQSEFDALGDTTLVAVHHGDQCLPDLDQMVLFWDLWVFGGLEVTPANGDL